MVNSEDQYHPSLEIGISLLKKSARKNIVEPTTTQHERHYHKADFRQMYELASDKSWTYLYGLKDPDETTHYFQALKE